MATIDYIFDEFQISKEEYDELERELGNLCYKVAWELKRKNFKNNYTDDIEDIVQDLRWAMSRAFIYTKRQRYIEASIKAVKVHCKDPFIIKVLSELFDLWNNRTHHGANKQKFGAYQEKLLDKLVEKYVPLKDRPNKDSKLSIDEQFIVYCKANIWNCSKNLGKKITRERSIRSGMVSLSENEFLL